MLAYSYFVTVRK